MDSYESLPSPCRYSPVPGLARTSSAVDPLPLPPAIDRSLRFPPDEGAGSELGPPGTRAEGL